ncbi:hypothetical protein DCAR_0101398 [Daucus carota subsp. sativus]|uniref:ATP-dependent DNA helicase n=1 Tax=Daucus carota subsp. sativus TaxID=79200 RepID=A0AAF0W3E4_DAUCS|nr:hypothetical protein DCAR_0101398 [Daucus carota subsp. sativus]
MLERDNVLVNIFRQLRERYTWGQPEPISVRLLERRKTDGHFENLPTTNDYEFAGLVVDDDFSSHRDIVGDNKKKGLEHISELHPSFMSLQYPLLFPFGEDGYRNNIKHRGANNSETQRNDTVSMREYYAFRAQYRTAEGRTLLVGGRLLLQFLVDACFRPGDVDATDVGKRIILPSSFTGGFRYMQQNYQDSLAVCKEYGHPDLFITFTSNPKWDEVQEVVRSSGSHDASVRPDIVARVFKMKLDAMINDFTKKHVLGRVLAGFKRCFILLASICCLHDRVSEARASHAHIVLWLAPADKLLTVDEIDDVICAEIPDKLTDQGPDTVTILLEIHGTQAPTTDIPSSSVKKLCVDEVRLRDNETLPEVVWRVDPDGTMFIQWMLNNRNDELGRDLTFIKYPTKFRWDASAKRWFRRKQNIEVVGRMVYAHLASGERFYMRLLLNLVVGPQSFEDIRTVDNIIYPTYKEACFHRGLLESDKEWHIALSDASLYANASQIRDLFVTLLVFCEISNPSELWEKHWAALADDIEYTRRKITKLPNLKLTDDDKQMLALEAINGLLKQYGKRIIFDRILESVLTNNGGFYFIYGPGGTGKTFLWSTIIATLRSEGKIVLPVASSGIASLLMEGGRTAHLRFKIPIDVNEFSCCDIKQNTHLAELICNTGLVIWDEAPMTNRFVFEVVDRTFRDIRSKINEESRLLPFGGLTMVLGGDFRQILPVIPRKGR